jgi:hypothetical protein
MKTLLLIPLFCFALSGASAFAQSAGPAAAFGSAARTMAPDVQSTAPQSNPQETEYSAGEPAWPGSTTYSKSDVGRATGPSPVIGRASASSSAVGWASAPTGSATAIRR